MQHRSFTVPPAPDGPVEGPSFDLAGQTFRCLPEAPSGVLAQMVAGVGIDGRGNQVFSQADLLGFIEGILIEREWVEKGDGEGNTYAGWEPADDVERFREVVFSKEIIVPIEVLGEVVKWLARTYTGRPT